jgi:hypothetical protein
VELGPKNVSKYMLEFVIASDTLAGRSSTGDHIINLLYGTCLINGIYSETMTKPCNRTGSNLLVSRILPCCDGVEFGGC